MKEYKPFIVKFCNNEEKYFEFKSELSLLSHIQDME